MSRSDQSQSLAADGLPRRKDGSEAVKKLVVTKRNAVIQLGETRSNHILLQTTVRKGDCDTDPTSDTFFGNPMQSAFSHQRNSRQSSSSSSWRNRVREEAQTSAHN